MKTKLTYSIVTALALVGAVTFIGCSSSGSSSDEAAATTLEGTFVDSAVQGLTYKGNLSGVTDAGGHYSFKGTDTVEFLLGSLSMGSLTPRTSDVSVLDFFGSTTTIDDEKVQKLIVLLQSLDVDGDATNGITIPAETVAALEAQMELLYPGQTLADLSLSDITALVTAVVVATDPVEIVDPETNTTTTVEDEVVTPEDATDHFTETLYGPQPPAITLSGTKLACTPDTAIITATDAADWNASDPLVRNVSSHTTDDTRERGTSHNAISNMSGVIVNAREASGTLIPDVQYHPIVISYLQEVVYDATAADGGYEMGDGSADIGDPNQRDAVFFATSLDNGETWKSQVVSDSTAKSSTQVTWAGSLINYGGHAQKPEMAIYGNRIMMAWHDKYCPSGNPFDLAQVTVDENVTYPDDFFAVNGTQGSIDYEAIVAPNDKIVYEVPFSCVWTARGTMDVDGNITWHAPMQLTTGKRDSNHIWLEASDAGFAMAWQEDTKGLRSGKGAGPGDGWSGATTNHGTDIWYTSLKMSEFDDINETAVLEDTKPKSLYNFHYPMRITDNEQCQVNDSKLYCQTLCDTYGSVSSTTLNNAGTTIERCKTYDVDMLTNTQVILDGDTGASRSALKILKTDMNESVVILSYEETKGLSESLPGEPEQDKGDSTTLIEFEGKSVYFESFNFNAIDEFNATDPDIIQKMSMPLVSAGGIVNMKIPDENNTSNMIYENARRVVIGSHIDSCLAENFTFALLYKESFETQGASSDMFVRVNNGFTYDTFVALNDAVAGDLNVSNVSAQIPIVPDSILDYTVQWTADNLDDYNYENKDDNTFSPRIFLRGTESGGDSIFTGYVYSPDANKTASENGNMPSNFHVHVYSNGQWNGPVNVTGIVKASATSVDPRLFTTPKGNSLSPLDSDKYSDPKVLFLTWGEIDWIDPTDQNLGKSETGLYYKRSIDGGLTWDVNTTMLANKDFGYIEEKEVNSYASPDGKTFYNVWIQESEEYNSSDHFSGLDTWFGRVDYNISNVAPN
ncbi:hypothetical protein KJ870_01410 [bacterium]|nr:hypothetical protein [bacterium]MBU1433583.1 hypothetical protein [bacterium]MBU1503236.1 hypothetical protein [bacterium]